MSLTLTTGGIKLKEGVPISENSTVLATGPTNYIELNRLKAILEIARKVHTKGICRAFEYLLVSDSGSASASKTKEANRTNSVQ